MTPLITHLKEIILLDAGSTVNLFMIKDLVSSIMRSNKTSCLETNGGTSVSNLEATFDKADTWFNYTVIEGILSHSLITNHCHIVSDSKHGSYFFVCIGAKG